MDARAHFGAYAREYRAYRPDYPDELFDLVAEAAPGRERVWDCGSGSGQAVAGLAHRFANVVATDISSLQLGSAESLAGVVRAAARAENAPFRDGSFRAVTVAQALHWFEFDAFFSEVARVSSPGALFATWTYGLLRVSDTIDRTLDRLHGDVLSGFWLPRRRHVEEAYANIPVPFEPLDVHRLEMVKTWTLSDLLGYLDTWSAGRAYRDEHAGRDPVDEVRADLKRGWTGHAGAADAAARVVWPLTLRRFRIG